MNSEKKKEKISEYAKEIISFVCDISTAIAERVFGSIGLQYEKKGNGTAVVYEIFGNGKRALFPIEPVVYDVLTVRNGEKLSVDMQLIKDKMYASQKFEYVLLPRLLLLSLLLSGEEIKTACEMAASVCDAKFAVFEVDNNVAATERD